MATLTFLGSSAAIPALGHDNVFLALEGEQSTVLVDCGGSPLLKLQLAGIDPAGLRSVIFTHRHPDHMYGFPMLMLDLWLLGLQTALRVAGEKEGLQTAQQLLQLFHSEEWPGFEPPLYHEVTMASETVALDLPDLLITASPSKHIVPSLALRFLNKHSGLAVVYSGDTEPCDEVVRLARGADVLIHEAAGASTGHSSPAQAGMVARQAKVGKLYLVHYPVLDTDLAAMLDEARLEFSGPVELARDFGVVEF